MATSESEEEEEPLPSIDTRVDAQRDNSRAQTLKCSDEESALAFTHASIGDSAVGLLAAQAATPARNINTHARRTLVMRPGCTHWRTR